ncbi:MAG: hypothetical protein PHR06_13370 [Candidatus Cloacimonetes bacterium]|nr:hypothetical protein [Candidatus Cloacimonadota bacterium]
MKRVVAAKLEQILEFDSEQEADEFIEKMKGQEGFDLLDYDNFGDETNYDLYRIRILKQYNKSPILESTMGLIP